MVLKPNMIQQVTCSKVHEKSSWKNKLVSLEWVLNKLTTTLGFDQSKMDSCVLYWRPVIFIVFVDDKMCLRKSEHQLVNIVKELQVLGLNIDEKVHQTDYFDVNIRKNDDSFYEFSQYALIKSIIEDVGLSYAKTENSCCQKATPCFQKFSFLQQWRQTQLHGSDNISRIIQCTSLPISQLILRRNCVFGKVFAEDPSFRDWICSQPN